MDILISKLGKKNSFFLKTFGSSMKPLLLPNDVIFYKKSLDYKVNDIVVVNKGTQTFTHRIIYKMGRYFITKGDNNHLSEGKITKNNILGRVYQVKRNGQVININDIYLIQSTLYFKEIIKIKTELEKNTINHVFLKGLPLYLYFEGNHPRRLYADCDLLIDKNFLDKTEKILFKNGFKKNNSGKNVEITYDKVIGDFKVSFDVHLQPAFLMTKIDNLEALYPQKLIDQMTEEFLKTKQEISVNDSQFLILNSQFLILYLALHIFHHNFKGSYRYELLDKIIRRNLSLRGSKTTEAISKLINQYRLENFVSPVFYLLKKYYQTPIHNFMNGSNKFDPYKNLNIFDGETRLEAGVNRFKNIFFLSSRPLIIKLLVFLNPAVIYLIFFSLKKKLSYFLKAQQ